MQDVGPVHVFDEPAPDRRAVRAQAMIGVASLGLLVVAVAYVQPSLAAAPQARSQGPPPAAWQIDAVSFGTGDQGAVGVRPPGAARTITYLTADGGRSWTRPALGDVTIGFPVPGRAVALAQPPAVGAWASEDAGRSWHRLAEPPPLDGMPGRPVFLDGSSGWWLRQPAGTEPRPVELWKTADGGRSWRRLPGEGLTEPGAKGQLLFLDSERGALVVFPPGTRWPSLLVTRDAGVRWRLVPLPAAPSGWGVPVGRGLAASAGRLVAWATLITNAQGTSGRTVSIPGSPTVALATWVSEDGGSTWSQPTATAARRYEGPAPAAPQFDGRGRLLWLVGHRLWVSDDAGRTWAARIVQAPSGVRPQVLVGAPPGALVALGVRPGQPTPQGTAAGSHVLLRSRDGGARWEELPLPPVRV